MATTKTVKKASNASKKSTVTTRSTASSKTDKDVTINSVFTKYKKLILIISGILILAALLFLGRGLFIAATVNGQPISRFAIIKELERQGGKQALEKEITRSLVFQEAAKKNVTASQEEIDKEIDKITKQIKAQGQDLNELLKAQGISQEDFQKDIKMQIVVTELLGDKTKVTDKEVDDFIAKNEALMTEEQDPAKAKENVKLQLTQQKLSTEYQKWIEAIRKNANVLQFVEY